MAIRPVFKPTNSAPFTQKVEVEFQWHPGLAKSQAQKSIDSLHHAAHQDHHIENILEISSKSKSSLGIKLSAFNLSITYNKQSMTVETAFQGSKVFSEGGPYHDLYESDSISAKKDPRISNSGELIGFKFFNLEFPLKPTTFFYDWLYLQALNQNQTLAEQIMLFDGFSDIAFNPKKSLNCQAKSAALYVALKREGTAPEAITNRQKLEAALGGLQPQRLIQEELFADRF